MSTLRVSAVNNAAATTGGLSIDSSGVVTGGLPSPNRNLLYNGAMQVAQRGTSTTGITTGGYYTADRWATAASSGGTWTQTVENDAPTGSGLRKSVKMLCTTANNSLSAGSFMFVAQTLEGQDLQRIAKGTSAAQQLTLSFWVKANVTGTYIVEFADADNTRLICASYTVSASATWEKKTITLPADTTGAFDNDNSGSLQVVFWLVAGSTFTSGTLQTTWAANSNANRAVGQTNLAAATNNYWQITGVQLEVGPTATGFEFKSFGRELAECQRYYWRIVAGGQDTSFGVGFNYGTTTALALVPFPVPMRAAPTALEQSGTAADYRLFSSSAAGINCSSVVSFNKASAVAGQVVATVASGLTAGNGNLLAASNATAYLGWSAEL